MASRNRSSGTGKVEIDKILISDAVQREIDALVANDYGKNHHWTDAEKSLLKKYYASVSIKTMQKIMTAAFPDTEWTRNRVTKQAEALGCGRYVKRSLF